MSKSITDYHTAHPVHFRDARISVGDDAVSADDFYFPMQDLLGAQVLDLESRLSIEEMPEILPDIKGRWLTLVIFVVYVTLNFGVYVSGWDSWEVRVLRLLISVIFIGVMLPRLFIYGDRRRSQRQFLLTVHTNWTSEELIISKDYFYLRKIADEINRRVLEASEGTGGEDEQAGE